MKRLSDYVVDRLVENNIKDIFMLTGRGILYLSDAVARNKSINPVCCHNEQAISYAAKAYSDYKNSFSACLISTGCGSTNAISGLLCAWQDNTPCVFISGQNKVQETTYYTDLPIRTFGNQEANIIEIVKSITKYSVMITDKDEIACELDKAFYYANEGRKGPVWIDIPLDIQNSRIDEKTLKRFYPENKINIPEKDVFNNVARDLINSKRPVLMIGSGIRSSNAVNTLRDFIQTYNIPLVCDSSAVDICSYNYMLNMGTVSSISGNRSANFSIQNSDYVLAIGTSLSPVTTGEQYSKFVREGKITVVDIDGMEHTKSTVSIEQLIICDPKMFLDELEKCLNKQELNIDYWREKCVHWRKIFPKCEDIYKSSKLVDMHYMAEVLSDVIPDNCTVITDSGLAELIFPSVMDFKENQRCIHMPSQGAMGASLPSSIGVSTASNDMVISINGDGSMMMNLQELQTIVYNNLPVKIFILNNNAYSVIRHRQEELFRKRTIGTDKSNGLSCANYEKVAEAFGIQYYKIDSCDNLAKKIKNVIYTKGIIICEVMCVENQSYLSNSYVKTKENIFSIRPIEDQFPFMDREIFLKEMIVRPIDQ